MVKVVLGRPAAGWIKVERLLSSGTRKARVPLSENTKAGRTEQKRKQREKKVFSSRCLRQYFPVLRCQRPLARASTNFIFPDFNRSEGGGKGNILRRISLSLKWIRGLQSQWGQRIDSVPRLLRMQQTCWKQEELALVEDSKSIAVGISRISFRRSHIDMV